jgi:hypothetical protein
MSYLPKQFQDVSNTIRGTLITYSEVPLDIDDPGDQVIEFILDSGPGSRVLESTRRTTQFSHAV